MRKLETPKQPKRYLTLDEAAQFLCSSPRLVRELCSTGKIRYFKPNKRLLFREVDLVKYVEGPKAS